MDFALQNYHPPQAWVKRGRTALRGLLCLGLALVLAGCSGAENRPRAVAEGDAAALARLFLPPHAGAGVYRVEVSAASIESLAGDRRHAYSPSPPGAWQVERLDPLAAFGTAGPYDRSRLARLYDGARVRVARGPVMRDGRVIESHTLISPYPAPSLDQLVDGTMIVVFRVPDELGEPAKPADPVPPR